MFLVTASVLLLAIKGNESGRALSIGALNVGEDERGYKSGNNWISLSGRFIEGDLTATTAITKADEEDVINLRML